MRFVLAIWAVMAWTLVLTVSILVVLLSIPVSLFIPFARFQGGIPAWVVGRLPHLTLSSIRITCDPGYDPKRVSMYVQNHVSSMDGYVSIRALPHPFCGLLNESHLRIPGYGWIMRLGNAIGVPKDRSGRTAALTRAAMERATRGISLLVFPEAHRTRDGAMRPFRKGVFFMARDAGLPVVPVAVRGLWEILPRGQWIPRPGRIEIHIGAAIETDGLSDDEVGELAVRTQDTIQAWLSAAPVRG